MNSATLKIVQFGFNIFGYDLHIMPSISVKFVENIDCVEILFGNLNNNPFKVLYIFSPYSKKMYTYELQTSNSKDYQKKVEIYPSDNNFSFIIDSKQVLGFVFSTGRQARTDLIWALPIKLSFLVNFTFFRCYFLLSR